MRFVVPAQLLSKVVSPECFSCRMENLWTRDNVSRNGGGGGGGDDSDEDDDGDGDAVAEGEVW
jgi:hypothetical protein